MSDEIFRWVIAGGVGLAAVCFLVMAIVSVVVSVKFGKLKAKIDPLLDASRPMAEDARDMVSNLKPKVLLVSDQAAQVSKLVLTEAKRYSEISKDVAERTKAQVARIDGAVDQTVDSVQEAGVAARRVVLKPIRQIDGVFAGFRRAMQTYSQRSSRASVIAATQDEEMFI